MRQACCSAPEKMYRWREHFERVLNHEEPPNSPEVEPGDELNIRTGRITRVEIKRAVQMLKSEKKQAATIYHQRQSRLEVRFQKRFFWTSATGNGVRSRCRRNRRKEQGC